MPLERELASLCLLVPAVTGFMGPQQFCRRWMIVLKCCISLFFHFLMKVTWKIDDLWVSLTPDSLEGNRMTEQDFETDKASQGPS